MLDEEGNAPEGKNEDPLADLKEKAAEMEKRPRATGESEKIQFRAETKKLLDIVAKSIYTDKEVFLRELLSNSSDALEKQRYLEISGESMDASELQIHIETDEKERTISIFDSGIGMSRDEIA